ncbi:MAG: preprotein translocase subunit SecA [Candidatus Omnitrophica bacterium]|nr:preprotein translocase subunit SecA [Candidatus Omnitrophota bacterium]MDD5351753.1 preprotein translocase subunit SecA [Candidatus Omnitrophota bacterium]MDD5550964.1 preprotein translocase subunit SecA [Candidatus Omnitrophota bacterium]
MVNFIIKKILGTQNERELNKLSKKVQEINALEPKISQLSDVQLRQKTIEFKEKVSKFLDSEKFSEIEDINQRKKILQSALAEVLAEAFAVVREAGKRTVGMRHFDVQLIGGMALHEGKIAEMATGEGKTLVATLAAYLNALSGKGVHIVTVNDYLAKRDREWMGPIYEFLGISVGVIQNDMPPHLRKQEYSCDIVYGTNNEFGFDYLRDNMVISKEEMVQRELNFAIVDEVDSILIDEARTPLIISGPAEESTDKYYIINRLVPKLKRRKILEKDEIEAKYKGEDLSKGFDAIVDEKNHTVSLTEEGVAKCESLLGISNLYDDISTEWVHHIIQAIRAHDLYEKDVDYVVKEGKVLIVDEFTGRLMPGRRWSDGLHQAVESKENIKIERENQTLATITLQNYFRMYNKLSGMTGTAFTEANEFKAIYGLDVLVIPTNKHLIRTNHPDAIYKSEEEKFDAVANEIVELFNKGRPVLVGTISIEKSERLSSMLKKRGIPHNVLNAKYHEMEAHIVAQAGRYKAVTIATNMAGRGTDILLGGNPEFMARNIVKAKGLDLDSPEGKTELEKELKTLKAQTQKEHNQVVELDGLHVIGTERHEARRIDNQLRGRSGRQGDPGSSRFYISLGDDLMRLFGSDRLIGIMDKLGMEKGQVIEHPWISRSIEMAQKRVEAYNFEIRKQLLEYDNVMNTQREIIYSQRRMVLENSDVREDIMDMVNDVFDQNIELFIQKNLNPDNWDLVGLENWLRAEYGSKVKIDPDKISNMDYQQAREYLSGEVMRIYQDKENKIGPEQMRHLERMITLQIVDTRWKEHLYAMDSLKEGIGLRAYGQKDPLIEYKNEGYILFQQLVESIKKEVVEFLFRIQAVEEKGFKSVFKSLPVELVHQEFSGLSKAKNAPLERQPLDRPDSATQTEAKRDNTSTVKRDQPKVGRNDPCPCGSGKKYKKCCGK